MLDRLFGGRSRKRVEPAPAAAAPQPAAVDVTDSDFAQVVLRSGKPAVVDFWSADCQPCQIMAAYMEFLARDLGDQLVVAFLDVDENPETTAQFLVMGTPTVILLRDGQEIDRILGVGHYEDIKRRVQRLLTASQPEL